MTQKIKGQKNQFGSTDEFVDIDSPKSAELGQDKVLRFKNIRGNVVFSVNLAGLTAKYSKIVPESSEIVVMEGESGHLGIRLASPPPMKQVVRLSISSGSVTPNSLEFTPENWDILQTVDITAPQDDNLVDETAILTLYSKRVSPENVRIQFKDNDVFVNGKEIVSDLSIASKGIDPDYPNSILDSATGQILKGYANGAWYSYWPFKDQSAEYPKTIAGNRLYANTSGAYSFIFIGRDNREFNGLAPVVGNIYGSHGWNTVKVSLTVKYINTENTVTTLTIPSTESTILWSETPTQAKNWKLDIGTIALKADGQVEFFLGDVLVYTHPAPEDFVRWTFKQSDYGWSSLSIRQVSLNRLIIVNDAVTSEEISDFYDQWLVANNAVSLRAAGVVLLPGDNYQLQPKYYTQSYASPTFESGNSTVATVSDTGEVTAVSTGTAAISLTTSVAGQLVKVSDDVQVTTELPFGLTSTRTATDIVFARTTDELEVGDEFSAQAYVLSEITENHPYPYGYPDDNLVKFISSNPEVCSVRNGVLKGVSVGTATITASDLAGTVSRSFTVTVKAASSLAYTDEEVLILTDSDIDTSTTETTTISLNRVLADAHEHGYKKVVFPQGRTYYVSPIYGTISIPTQMVVDFNGCTVQIEESSMTSVGYVMFRMKDCLQSEMQNAIIYGERMLISGTGDEGCRSVVISGNCIRSGIRNCTISRSPGFNLGFSWTNLVRLGYKLADIESGGIDDQGQDVDREYSFRGHNYIDIASLGDKFALGNMQGYGGYLYMSARVYDIFFYDSNKTFLSSVKNCVQYYHYDRPANAAYARISYRWDSAPTSSDGDFHAIAHLYSFDIPTRCFVKDCAFEDSYSTAITPNGADGLLIDGCLFRNNGYRDPASHIDWEDGRQNNKGHIVRNCTFVNGGSVTLVGADGTVIHDNRFENCNLGIGNEVQNSRIWMNQFIGNKASRISTKTDMVFAQNFGFDGATYSVSKDQNADFDIRESGNIF